MRVPGTSWREKARLRPRELAEIAGVSVRTIHREIADGRLRSFREGRLRFVPIEAALAFVGERAPEAPAGIAISEDARQFVAALRARLAS